MEIVNSKKEIGEIKEAEKKQSDTIEKIWENLRKKPSTVTLLTGLAIIVMTIMGLLTLAYNSHQNRMGKLEAADQKTNERIDKQFGAIIKSLNVVYDKIPEKKPGPEKPKK